jgi:hypothetical protein
VWDGSGVILRPRNDAFEAIGIELVLRALDELEAKCVRDGLDVSERQRLRELLEWGRGWVDRRREGVR